MEEDGHDSCEENSRHPDTPDNTKLDQEETEETARVKLETESHKDIDNTDDASLGLGLNDQDDHEQRKDQTEIWETDMGNRYVEHISVRSISTGDEV